MLWHEHLRRTAKLAVVGGLHYSGLLGRMRRKQMRDRAVILMYHRVNPPGYGAPDYSPVGMSVTPEEFAMQMRFVRNHYDVVPLSRIVNAVRDGKDFPANLCAVTFDDGWEDVYRFAYPVMREQKIPATIFLTSGFIGGAQWFWEERSKYLLALLHQRRASPDFAPESSNVRAELEAEQLGELPDLSDAQLAPWLLKVGRILKQLDVERRAMLMNRLEILAKRIAPDAPRPFMNWEEISEMASNGIEFGNHTRSHCILPELSPERLDEELSSADAQIRAAIGRAPVDFAYPYGKFDDRVKARVQALGSNSACTTRHGLVERNADPFALKRINMCSDVSAYKPLFAARILGL